MLINTIDKYNALIDQLGDQDNWNSEVDHDVSWEGQGEHIIETLHPFLALNDYQEELPCGFEVDKYYETLDEYLEEMQGSIELIIFKDQEIEVDVSFKVAFYIENVEDNSISYFGKMSVEEKK